MPEATAFTNVAVGKDRKTVAMPTHQLVSNAEFPPKYIYVVRDTSLPSAFGGNETWCEFSLPREMGVLDSMRLAVDITVPAGGCVLMPTPYWAARVEYYWGSDLVETVYADDLFHEDVGMVSQQYFEQVAGELNVSRDFDLKTDPCPAGQSRFFIPLASHLTAMRPFVRGFDSTIRVRVYWAARITADPVLTNGNPSTVITLNEVQLFVCEAQMSRSEMEKAEKLHKHGVVQYAGIFRERQSDALSFNSSGTTPQYLRSFKHDSAGLAVYIQSQNGSNASDLVLAPVFDITLQDAVGNKLTEQNRGDFLKSFIYTDQVDSPFSTHRSAQQPNGANLYLIPFSSSFQDTVRTGNNYGKRALTSQERLIYTPVNVGILPVSATVEPATGAGSTYVPSVATPAVVGGTPTNAIVNITSYSYGFVVCKGGKHYVQMQSTADERSCGR